MGRRDAAPAPVVTEPVPVRISIPALGVDAGVVPVGVDAGGAMALPDDPRLVGWYQWGPAPGSAGNSVVAGHVDTQEQGPGALHDLRSVEPGTAVEVRRSDGTTVVFTVSTLQVFDKTELPTEELFARTGPGNLVLVTCGGDFDRAAGKYEDNVVVTATA